MSEIKGEIKVNKIKQEIKMVIGNKDTDFVPFISFLKTLCEMNGHSVEGNIENICIQSQRDWNTDLVDSINIEIKTCKENRLVLLDDKTIDTKTFKKA